MSRKKQRQIGFKQEIKRKKRRAKLKKKGLDPNSRFADGVFLGSA